MDRAAFVVDRRVDMRDGLLLDAAARPLAVETA
jgi:hypothetical protein